VKPVRIVLSQLCDTRARRSSPFYDFWAGSGHLRWRYTSRPDGPSRRPDPTARQVGSSATQPVSATRHPSLIV